LTAVPSLSRLQARHWGLVGVAAAVAAALGRPGLGGVLLGGASIGLVVVLYSAAGRMLLRQRRTSLAIGLVFVKLAAFLGLGWLAFGLGGALRPDPVGFALGLSCFPAATVWEAMRVRGRG
jgi:hypothetical protein